MVEPNSPPGGELQTEIPGLLFRYPQADRPFDLENDSDLLDAKIETKIGPDKIKIIEFSDNRMHAYVELIDKADIELLGSITLRKGRPPLVMECIDLMAVRRSYLIVKGLEDWITCDMIEDHFVAESKGERVESVAIDTTAGTAVVKFACPKVAFTFNSTETDFMGLFLQLEVKYEILSSSGKDEEILLSVTHPVFKRIPPEKIKKRLEDFFSKHTGKKATECKIVNGVGYLKFEDSADVQVMIANLSGVPFFAHNCLELSAVPVSEVEAAREEDPLTPITPVASPLSLNSSIVSSVNAGNYFGREVSLESSVSSFSAHIGSPQRNTSSENESEVGRFMPCRDSSQLASLPIDMACTLSQDLSKESPLFTLPGHVFVPPTFGSDSKMPVVVDVPSGLTPRSSNEDIISKVLVADVPRSKRDEVFLKSYLFDLTNVFCSLKQYGEQFLASFVQPIDFEVLMARKMSSGTFSFSISKVTSTKTILVANLKDWIGVRILKLHFEDYTEKNSVQNVKMLHSNKALVTFLSHSYVKMAMFTTDCWDIDDVNITMDEYYDFMTCDEEDGESQLSFSAASNHGHEWNAIQIEVEPLEAKWFQCTLQELNDKLKHLNACCTVSKGSSLESPLCLIVTPQDGSEAMSNWISEVRQVVDEVKSCFVKYSLPFPDGFHGEILSRAQEATGPNLLVRCSNGELVIGGHKDNVHQVELDLKYFIDEVLVRPEEKEYSRKCIRFLSYFSKHKLKIDEVTYTLDDDVGRICVKGKLKGRQCFWDAVGNELKDMQEKSIPVSREQFKLLASERGTRKIEELMDVASSNVLYHLERDSTNCSLLFLSPGHVMKGTLKTVKNKFKGFLDSKSLYVSQSKLRLCSDMKWRELVGGLENEAFISVTVDQSSSSVIVSGEKIVVGDAYIKIEKYFLEKCSREELLIMRYHEWKVICSNFKQRTDAIERDLEKLVKIVWPKESTKDVTVTIILKGDPKGIDDAKVRLEALQKEVFHKEEKMSNIPAANKLLGSIEDKICVLESRYRASINVSLVNNELRPHSASATSSSSYPHKLCGATLSNAVRVSLYSGDFTKHGHVDAMFNLAQLCPDDSDTNLMQLFATESGSVLQDEFNSSVKDMFHIPPGFVIEMAHVGQLKCNHLFHSFLCCWLGGTHGEEFYLEKCLKNILHEAQHSNTILLDSVCSKPLNYPASVFAKKLITVLSSDYSISSDLTVVVYVSDPSEATEFGVQFNNPKNCCSSIISVPAAKMQPTGARGKTISNPIDSLITLQRGDLLKQEAQVFVSSTNSILDLKTGYVSNALLQACGRELQKECSQYAPLKPGHVAVTAAKNLPCDFIYHIALPNHSDIMASKKFRETVQAILRTAKENNAKSVAIPSLGVGNLNYPAHVSANIIYEEIIYFSARNPDSVTKYLLVIYDPKIFDEFSKVHAQKMNSAPAKPKKEAAKAGKNISTKLSIENSDISDVECDIIVNTTDANMQLSKGAVSKALLNKAGANLQDACDQLVLSGLELNNGQIVTTKSYGKLQCKKLIHAHVLARDDAVKSSIDHFTIIHDIVLKCLVQVEKLGMKSVSFPAFGLGNGGYSVQEVACPMLTALQEFGKMPPRSIDTIKVIIYDQALHKQFSDFFLDFFKVDTSKSYRVISSIYSIASTITGKNQSRWVELHDHATEDLSPLQSISMAMPCSALVFDIYAPTESECGQIVSELKVLIRKKSKEEFIVNPTIANLLDTDLNEITKVGEDLLVQINVISEINKIQILGECTVVAEAKFKVMELLNAIEKTQNVLQLFEWNSYGNDGELENYSPEDSAMLERAFVTDLPGIELIIENVQVVIDLKSMKERSKLSGQVRTVKREKKRPATSFKDLVTVAQENSTNQTAELSTGLHSACGIAVDYLGEGFKACLESLLSQYRLKPPFRLLRSCRCEVYLTSFPDTWEEQPEVDGIPAPVHYFEVPQGSQEYQNALGRFNETIRHKSVNIIKLERIQNPTAYTRYITLRDTISQKYPLKKKIEVKELFHGMKEENIHLISNQGFNRNFAGDANAAYFGNGVYFALNANYSALPKYSVPNKDGVQFMFICSVIIGEHTVGAIGMKVPPVLEKGSSQVYDTLVDNKDNPTIFVAVTDAQAYPQYLVSFKLGKT